jgi:2-phospho-L-lactate guanylyltransferase (CobY/MobA/RfbA family)
MPALIVPFRATGKTRVSAAIRSELARAMLLDVVEAGCAVGRVHVVGDAPAGLPAGVERVLDPGGGQGAAVAAALAAAGRGHVLVVNADLPCATPAALRALAAHGPASVAAADGTTNALSLPDPSVFQPLYGPGSAGRFAALGLTPVRISELEHDVDTLDDLDLFDTPNAPTLGRRTRLVTDRYKAAMTR